MFEIYPPFGGGQEVFMSREMVICVLNEPGRLNDVLMAFLEAGVTSSTVIETQGMGKILASDVPLFAGFRDLFQGSKPFNHTIFAVVDDPSVTEELIVLVKDVLSDMGDEPRGIIFSLPINTFVNLNME